DRLAQRSGAEVHVLTRRFLVLDDDHVDAEPGHRVAESLAVLVEQMSDVLTAIDGGNEAARRGGAIGNDPVQVQRLAAGRGVGDCQIHFSSAKDLHGYLHAIQVRYAHRAMLSQTKNVKATLRQRRRLRSSSAPRARAMSTT